MRGQKVKAMLNCLANDHKEHCGEVAGGISANESSCYRLISRETEESTVQYSD